MAVVLKPKRGTNTPGTDDIVSGEIAIDTSAKKLYINDGGTVKEIGGGGSGGSTTEVTQSSHGFSVKDCIRHNGSSWVKAQADAATTLALGVVTEVADSNTFTVAQSGRFTISSHGLTVGQWYYLDASTAGALTATEPTISQPLVYVESASVVFVFPYRPTQLLVNGGASVVPGDGTVTLAKMAVNSVDSDQYVDGSIDTAHIANDQITNALMADDAVGVAQLSASGTASSSTFLRGDNSWAAVGGAYNDWTVKTAGYTAVAKDQSIINATSAVTVTLPSSATAGDCITLKNIGTHAITIGRNGLKIEGADQDGSLGVSQAMQIVYVSATVGWKEI